MRLSFLVYLWIIDQEESVEASLIMMNSKF